MITENYFIYHQIILADNILNQGRALEFEVELFKE